MYKRTEGNMTNQLIQQAAEISRIIVKESINNLNEKQKRILYYRKVEEIMKATSQNFHT